MSRRNIIIVVSILSFVFIIGGISYSYFVYNKDIGNVNLNTGEISINLSGINGNKTLTNVIPMGDNEGKTSSDYFDFTVDATVDTERIYYEVYLMPDDNNTLDTNYLKTYLTDQNNVEIKGVTIFDDLGNSEVENGKVIYKGIIEVNQNGASKNESKNFRLRIWLDENYQDQTSKTFTFDIYLYAKNVDENFIIPSLRNSIVTLASSANYVASYDDIITQNPTFTTQDQVSTNAPKQTVYYYTGDDAAANANVLFAGYCWQIVRTTDNGGVRMIYNGVAVNNKCETTRTATKGIHSISNRSSQNMSSVQLFGRGYDYDLDTGEFTIEDSTGLPSSWTASDNNNNGKEDYKELIGTYTCLSNSLTCSILYYVGSIEDSSYAYVIRYNIGDVAHFSQLGTSAFNPNYGSPALVGYMFNEEYDYKYGTKSGEYFTNAVWENGAYILSNSNNGTAPDATHHYICDNDCTKVRYYYYSTDCYILLENGITIEDAIYKMTGNGSNITISKTINANYELNNYNSSIKGYLDNWYEKNMIDYTSYLDGTSVYCNDRSISALGGWNPSGTSLTGYLQFKQYNSNRDLNCINETDRFAVTNNKAELTYPIGLLTEPERNLMTANFAKTGQIYWEASPKHFGDNSSRVTVVDASGGSSSNVYIDNKYGVRPVISLKPEIDFDSGTGTYTDPYIVGPLVTRTN